MKDTRFRKGEGGRPKGSRNKNATRTQLSKWVDENFAEFEKQMASLKGRAYCDIYVKTLCYVMPSYQSISMSLRNMSEDDLAYLISKLKEQQNEIES